VSGPDERLELPEESVVPAIARACAEAGGRALVVGGWVRDQLLGRSASRDLDLEIQGLAPGEIESLLARFGAVERVGRSFPVYLVKGLPFDVCLPRTGAPREDGEPPGFDPALDFAEAARGRDLRVNSMAWDPLRQELLDPYDGRRDIEEGVLRATDAALFGRDPLRGLRTAQLAARLGMAIDDELASLCAGTDLTRVAPERIWGEMRTLLLQASRPSRAFEVLESTRLLRFFPELAALVGVPQDAKWHPEGDVWVHTLLVIDVAASLRGDRVEDAQRDLLLMLGSLCHDLGKPGTTEEHEGRIVSRRHSQEGARPTEDLLARMRAPTAVVRATCALVRHHLAPAEFVRPGQPGGEAGPRAYRKLLRRLREDGVDAELLYRVARSDHLGRTTEDARAGRFEAGDVFLERARSVEADPGTYEAVVTGRHLIARGVEPGPEMGRLLARCREVQDEIGETDAQAILARVLG
jgi:tRNA nucleotidyltransferase (CCA-adding enzyme)